MLHLKKLLFVVIAIVAIGVPRGHCAPNQESFGILKDLTKQDGQPETAITEEDYLQIPSYLWADYETIGGTGKRSGKFKSW